MINDVVAVESFTYRNIKKENKFLRATYLRSIGEVDSLENSLIRPLVFALDSTENSYIFDASSFKIKKFDKGGNYLLKFGNKGSGPGEVRFPGALFITGSRINIVDNQSKKILRFTLDGKFIKDEILKEKGTISNINRSSEQIIALFTSYQIDPDGLVQIKYEINSYDDFFNKLHVFYTKKISFDRKKQFNPLESLPYFSCDEKNIYIDNSNSSNYLLDIYSFESKKKTSSIKRDYRKIKYNDRDYKEVQDWLKSRMMRGKKQKKNAYKRPISGMYNMKGYNFILLDNIVDSKGNLKFDLYKNNELVGKFLLKIKNEERFVNSTNIRFTGNNIYILNESGSTLDVYQLNEI